MNRWVARHGWKVCGLTAALLAALQLFLLWAQGDPSDADPEGVGYVVLMFMAIVGCVGTLAVASAWKARRDSRSSEPEGDISTLAKVGFYFCVVILFIIAFIAGAILLDLYLAWRDGSNLDVAA